MKPHIQSLVRCGSCYRLSDKGKLCSNCGMPLIPNKDMTRQELQKKIKGDD